MPSSRPSLLRLFIAVYRGTRWLRRRFTPAGLLVIALCAFAAAFGLDTESNAAHQVFTIGLALLLVDAAALGLRPARRLPRLVARRHLPQVISADSRTHYRLEVKNQGSHPSPALTLVEELQQTWPAAADLGARQRGRGRGYPAFLQLLRRLRAVDVAALELPPLLPGQGAQLEPALLATARGLAGFERLEVILSGPLGLLARRVAVTTAAASLPVLPQRLAVAVPPASSRRLLQPGGIALARHVGDSEEFRALRDYRPGDPLRTIHWRSFARTGKPMVREMQEEFFSRHALVLDTALPDADAARFETAVAVAAGLVARPRDADSLLDLLFVGEKVHRLTAGRGLGSADTLLRVLASVRPSAPESLAALFSSVMHHATLANSVIVVLLAWDAPRRQAINSLRASGAQLTVLLIGEDAGDESDEPLAPAVRRIPVDVRLMSA